MPLKRPVLLFCQHPDCGTGYGTVGEKPPQPCPSCERDTTWLRRPPWRLSYNDAQFLRSIRINPEREESPPSRFSTD